MGSRKFVLLSLVLAVAFVARASATPTVLARLGHARILEETDGDAIANDLHLFTPAWLLALDVTSGGPVTAPRVEFQSSRTFTDLWPTPTRIDPGPTYVWDYPDRTLTFGG